MTLSAKDKRKINTAALEEVEPDPRTAKERVMDNIGDAADKYGWLWNPLAEDSEFDFQLQRGRYALSVKLDNDGGMESAKAETDIRSETELYGFISSQG